MNEKIDYRKGGDEVRKAWFAYVQSLPEGSEPSVISFAAGFNAAMAELEIQRGIENLNAARYFENPEK